MKLLAPESCGMVEASIIDAHALLIATAIFVVVGIVVVTLAVLMRKPSAAGGVGSGRLVLKIVLLAAAAACLACYFLLDEGELNSVVAFFTGEPCCEAQHAQACRGPEDAQACCPQECASNTDEVIPAGAARALDEQTGGTKEQ